jgi:hypothetical protein
MPNTPMLVGEAMSAISAGTHATADSSAVVEKMLPLGRPRGAVPEAQQDAVTALSGSGPAYFFFLVEHDRRRDPDRTAARRCRRLIVQSAFGAALMLRESADHPVHPARGRDLARGHDDRRDPGAGDDTACGPRCSTRSRPPATVLWSWVARRSRADPIGDAAHPDAHLNAPTGCTRRSSSSHGPARLIRNSVATGKR